MNLLFYANNISASNSLNNSKNTSWPSFSQTLGQLFSLIIIMAIVVGLIFLFANMMTKFRVTMGSDNIKILEYKNIGLQNNLIIVQISNRYFLISSSKEKVSLIAELNSEDISKVKAEKNDLNFKEILGSYRKKNKDEVE